MHNEVEAQITQTNLKAHNVVEFGRFSYELEDKREQSILAQASQMMTAFSVCSAVLLMGLPVLLEYLKIPDAKLLVAAAICLLPLMASLLLALIAQWRFKYQTMQPIGTFQKEIENAPESYQYQAQYDCQWIYQISSLHESKKKNNDLRVRLLIASMICFIISMGILVLSALVLWI